MWHLLLKLGYARKQKHNRRAAKAVDGGAGSAPAYDNSNRITGSDA